MGTIAAIQQAIETWDDTPTCWGVDASPQIDCPRDGESEDVAALTDLFSRTGSLIAHTDGPTR
eukprot:45148-Pyramimonas_sp.AAC.1